MEGHLTELSVLVVDDEPLARRRIIRLLRKIDWVGAISEAAAVGDACEQLERQQPDILVLDIQMPGGSGFDVLSSLNENPPAVIFATAFDHHALQAFETNAVDYVTKPLESGRFLAAMERARHAVSSRTLEDRIKELQEAVATLKKSAGDKMRRRSNIWVKSKGDYICIAPETILRIHAERDYVRIHTDSNEYLYNESMVALEQRLGQADFIRVHRSSIIRRSAIVKIRQAPFSALITVLSDGSEVRVGRTYVLQVKESLLKTRH